VTSQAISAAENTESPSATERTLFDVLAAVSFWLPAIGLLTAFLPEMRNMTAAKRMI
jgi:hypothetical protein